MAIWFPACDDSYARLKANNHTVFSDDKLMLLYIQLNNQLFMIGAKWTITKNNLN